MSPFDNTQVIDKIYRDHQGWLYDWLRRRLGCSETAADLAQDTFVKLLSKPRRIDNIPGARGYLRTVAGRLCIDFWRRKSIEKAWLETLAERQKPIELSVEDNAIILETFFQIDAMLQRLPQKVATAFSLSQIEGKTYRQIARELGVSERTIKNYMAQAMYECVQIELSHYDALSG